MCRLPCCACVLPSDVVEMLRAYEPECCDLELASAERVDWLRKSVLARVLRSATVLAGLKDMMGGVPFRLPMTPKSSSASSSPLMYDSATLGGRAPIPRCPFCLLGGRMLLVELEVVAVDALDGFR